MVSDVALKRYQEQALRQIDEWIKALDETRIGNEDGSKDNPMDAWKSLEQGGKVPSGCDYVSRTTESGEPIPHVCLKIPTGGGKTLLGVHALERIRQKRGLVLWIVPSKAIYDQTCKAFQTRDHPYRKKLDRLSRDDKSPYNPRLIVSKKGETLTMEDIQNSLCVKIITLSSANRNKNKEFLKMFRDGSGDPSFFPEEDDDAGNGRLLAAHDDLETTASGQIKQSFFNALKLIQPTVILDEAHKAYGAKENAMDEFVGAVNRLNPRMVFELSATPTRGKSNILVDINGAKLHAEDMIKLPIEVSSFTKSAWSTVLEAAAEKLKALGSDANDLHQKENRYIRPIALVRVQHTGKDQREKQSVHSEDVRNYLIQKLSVPEHEIRVQSSQQKELGGEDLLAEQSQVRWIITKDALKEGWDCSFAYVLVLLDNTKAVTTMTQMVGRVLRQPHASRIETSAALNRCYVYCYNRDLGDVIKGIKGRLEKEGLADISNAVLSEQDGVAVTKPKVKRRAGHRSVDIFLPKVLHKAGRGWRELDYSQDILGHLNWEAINIKEGRIDPDDEDPARKHRAEVSLASGKRFGPINTEDGEEGQLALDWFVRQIVADDETRNPWQMARIVDDFLQQSRKGRTDDKRQKSRYRLLQLLQDGIRDAVDKNAKEIFSEKVAGDEIRFHLHADKELNYLFPESFGPTMGEDQSPMLGKNGEVLKRNLYEPVYESHFNGLEKEFALYLDSKDAVNWWHRIAVGQQSYSLQGWQKRRVYPDFLVLLHGEDKGFLILETKGDHLKGNDDTEYKKKLLTTLETIYKKSTCRGEVELGSPPGPPVRLRMMFETGEDGWKEEIRRLLHENPTVSQYEKNGSVSSKNLQK